MPPFVGINLDPSPDHLAAALPLFEADEVEAVEFSFDTCWPPKTEPDWLSEVVGQFSSQNRLFGHGVHFSALSAGCGERHEIWLERLKSECARRRYVHISEHFGFLAAGSFHESAPLPVPLCTAALQLASENLRRAADISGVPFGLENLAFAFSPAEVARQGFFLESLLHPIDGFLLLDLHNIYCQSCNFGVALESLLDTYPLHRVREIHVSGGSWSHPAAANGDPFRRDTHDGPVPAALFSALHYALARCPNLKVVIFERLGGTLDTEPEQETFRQDFRRLRDIVHQAPQTQTHGHNTGAMQCCEIRNDISPAALQGFQSALLDILDEEVSAEAISVRLRKETPFAQFQNEIAAFDLRAIETAAELVRKWGKRDQ